MFPKITRLIPQRSPFLMVDEVVSCEGCDAVTIFRLTPGNILIDGDRLSVAGIIENMAQSCAARMGCVDWMRGEPIKIGYVGDVKDCSIVRRPRIGETLHTHVHIVEKVFSLMLAEVTVSSDDEPIASACMKIAMTNIEAYLEE